VLALTPDFPPARGGIQILLHGVLSHASRLRPRVVTLGSPGAREFDAQQEFEVRRVPWVPRSRRASFIRLNAVALREARRFRPQVVLSGHIVTAPAAWAVSKLLRVRWLQYLHADEVRAAPRLSAFALRQASAVIAVSRYTEQVARSFGASAEKIHRIPPGLSLPERQPPSREGQPTLLTVSRLTDAYKGHDVVLRALPLIQERVPDARWVVLGDGPLRQSLERQAREQGLLQDVRFMGEVSDAARDSWYRSSHVFLMPSRLPADGGGEGFGIVYLEAAAHGLPVVAGDVAGARDAVVEGETGLLVDPTDPAEVATAVSDLLLAPERAAELGAKGADRAEQFAWPSIVPRVEDVILDLAGERGVTSR
jgi:phosphatidyl-myo-inositol dimannoside synthase